MPLVTLPKELIERTVFWSGTLHHLLPPKDIIAIVSTCRNIHDIVLGTSENHNYAVLADISRARYSTSAPRRRLGPAAVTNRSVAMELTIRVPTLRRVRQCNLRCPHLVADLWVVYHMCIEDDGFNIEQLNYAQAEFWVSQIIRLIPLDNDGWPLETEVAHLAVAIYSLLAPRHPLTIDQNIHEEVLAILQNYVFATYRYQMSYLTVTALTQQYADDVTATRITNPVTLPNPLWGHTLHMSLPPIAISATLCFLDSWADVDSTDPRDNTPLNSQRFDADYCRLILSCISFMSEAARKDLFTWPPSEEPVSSQSLSYLAEGSVTTSATASISSVDTDARLLSCWYGVGRLWAPGLLTGEWTGEGNIPFFEWYLSMSYLYPSSHLPTFKFGRMADSPDGTLKWMKLTLCEHVRTDKRENIKLPTLHDGSLGDTMFHEIVKEARRFSIYEKNYRLIIRDKNEQNPLYRIMSYYTVTRNDDQQAPPHKYHNDKYGVATKMPSPVPLPVLPLHKSFSSGDSGFGSGSDGTSPAFSFNHPSPSVSSLASSLTSSSRTSFSVVSSNKSSMSSGIGSYTKPSERTEVDMVITGELQLGPKTYELFGRVRRKDGLVVLVHSTKVPADHRWIFHGYVVGGCVLVGRWRDTSIPTNYPTFQGMFVLKKHVALR